MKRATQTLVLALGCLLVTGCPDDPSGSAGAAGAGSSASGAGGTSNAAGSDGSDDGGGAGDGGGASGTDGGASGGSVADAGAGGTAGKGGSSGASGKGGAGAAGKGGSSGGSGEGGSSGSSGAAGTGGGTTEPKLPDNTLLFVRHETKDHDVLVARDLAKGTERVLTDLTDDGSSGWEIDSFSLSPDRTRIAFASLFGPTAADTATGLATRAIWTMSTEGKNFQRLTPTFPNGSQGRSSYSLSVGDPEWLADGSRVVFDFGEYWWENGQIEGGSFPWSVASAGGTPTTFSTPTDCGQVLYPSRNPVTGELLFYRGLCIPGQGDGGGLYLYPATGTTAPTKLVDSAHVDGKVDVFLTKAAWFPDGSGFAFIGAIAETDWSPTVLLYDANSTKTFLLAQPPQGSTAYGVAVSTDGTKAVYCVRDDATDAEDLRLLDLAADPITDSALTTDGKSCSPAF
jgi:Tol biopolymer transport system component